MSPIVLFSSAGGGLGEGHPIGAVPGTPTSVPKGLEAVFSYNNLVFNDTTTVDKFRVLQIDGLDDPDVRDTREDIPASDGEMPLNAFYGGRTMAFNGRIEAYTLLKLRDMQQALRSAFLELGEKPLYFLTGDPLYDHYIKCRKFSKLQWNEEQKDDRFFRDFLITLRASNPRFLRSAARAYGIDFAAGERYITAINEGNYDAQPIITVSGPVTGFTLLNEATGKSIKIKDTVPIPNGDFWVIDFTGPNMTIRNSAGINKFNDLAFNSNPFSVRSGSQILSMPTGGGRNISTGLNTFVNITYRDSWI